MRRWWLVLLLLLSVGVNLGVIGMLVYEKARPKPPEPRQADAAALGGGGDLIARLPRFANHLGLEGEERRKFLDIQVALFQETTRLRLRMAEIQRSLRLEMTSESTDAGKADELLRESAEVYLQMERAFVRSVLESRQLLGEKEEKRYLQVLARLRANARGQFGLVAPNGQGGAGRLLDRRDRDPLAPGGAGAGARPSRPRGLAPLQERRRQRFLERLEPRIEREPKEPGTVSEGPVERPGPIGEAGPSPWKERQPRQGIPPREMQEMKRQRMEWRLRQRERLQQQRRPGDRQASPQSEAPPPSLS